TYAADAQLYDRVKARAQRIMQARAASPAASVMEDQRVAGAYDAAANDPALMPRAIDTALAAQTAIGIAPDDQRVLPDAHGAVARLAVIPAAEAPGAIDGMRQRYGKY